MMNVVTFVSLGPGDPEWLTLKALRLLKEADLVMIPATRGADGQVTSRAQDIICMWTEPGHTRLYPLPMSHERKAALAVYDQIRRDAAEACRSGQRVVIAVEGDISIYASVYYVLEKLRSDGIPVAQCPGVPSFIAAASLAGLSLASQRERLVVLPGDADEPALEEWLQSGHVVVVMKLSQCADTVKRFLRRHPHAVCHYFENVGTPKAYHTKSRDEILSRRIPYFSLCVLYPGEYSEPTRVLG